MPEHLKALVVIITTSITGFYIMSAIVRSHGFNADLAIWKRSWFLVTICAFLAHSVVIFFILLSAYVIFAIPKDPSIRLPVYLLLVLALPNLTVQIPGFGLINYFFDLSYSRLLAGLLLLPCLTNKFVRGVRVPQLMTLKTDKYVLSFVAICAILDFRGVSFTAGLRESLYYLTDVLLPYYVFSRYVRNEEDVKKILFCLLIPIFIMSIMSFFEILKSWHFYTALSGALGLEHSGQTSYRFRGGFLRAYGPYGAIPFGLLISLAFVALLHLLSEVRQVKLTTMSLILLAGLVFTLSRGPWAGFLVMMLTYLCLARDLRKHVPTFLVIAALSLPVLLFTNMGNKVLDMLPFIGAEEEQVTISYRQDVFTIGIDVARDAPLFGDHNFLQHPKMQVLIQGEGIIDIVNTYMQYLLQYGYVGLAAFFVIFISVLQGLWRMRTNSRKINNSTRFDLSNIFITMWAASLTVIATVSSMSNGIVSITYWLLVGLSVAMANHTFHEIDQSVAIPNSYERN